MLRQELSSYENNWFKEKYENLLKQHEQKRGCDPKTLLAFNIMKENFNEASINKSVKAFVCDKSIEPKQLRMLKHLSFLNAFDLHFQSVPLSCFDPIMAPPIQWIRDIPPSFRVLTSRCNRQGYGGKILSIRMSNYLLSRSVLNTIIELESENGELRKTIGEVALDVMSSACFRTKFYKEEHKILQKIIGDISKKRDRTQNGKGIGKLEKFSPLITELLEQCDKDQAIQIVSETYDITNDALVSQQLARLHAELENWDEAFTAIDNGIDQKPYNSYLVHTKGHLYKEHMQALFSQYSKENAEVPISEINNAIKYTKLSIDCFRTCQELSENQDSSQPNPAGYESEILVAVELVRLLKKCPVLRTYAHVRTLIQREDISQENQVFLERLPESIAITIDKLERIIHGTIRHFFHSHSRSLYTVNKMQLDKHKQEFTAYFVEENRSDTSMSKDAHCQVDVWSLLSALRVHEIDALMRMIQSMSKNTSHLSKPRLRIFLAICLSVSVSNPSILPIREDVLMNTSRRYYESSSSTKNELAKLESYLYFTVFHWPLQSRQKIRNYLSPYSTWSAAVKLWLEQDRSTSGKQKRNDKILFYFGKSHDYPNVLKLETLSSISALARFKGTVNQNGTEIEIMIDSFQSTQPSFIWIPFHKKITRSTIYNRVVEVVIGVGLQGPRADWIEKPSSFRLGQNFCRIQLSSSLENNYHGYRSTEPHAASDQDRHNILKGSRQQSFERNLQYPSRMRNTRQRQNFRIPDCHSRYDMSVRDLQGDSTYISNRSVHRHPDNGFTSDSLQFPYQHPTSLNAGLGTSMARVPAHFHIPPPPTMPAVGVNFYNNPGVYSGGDRNQRYSGNNYSSTNRVLQRMNNWPEVGRDRLSDLRDSRHEGNGFIRAPETVLRGYRGTRQRRQSHRFQNTR